MLSGGGAGCAGILLSRCSKSGDWSRALFRNRDAVRPASRSQTVVVRSELSSAELICAQAGGVSERKVVRIDTEVVGPESTHCLIIRIELGRSCGWIGRTDSR